MFGCDIQVRICQDINLKKSSIKENEKMISRIWHGYTSLDNADKYEALLKEEIFIGIRN